MCKIDTYLKFKMCEIYTYNVLDVTLGIIFRIKHTITSLSIHIGA